MRLTLITLLLASIAVADEYHCKTKGSSKSHEKSNEGKIDADLKPQITKLIDISTYRHQSLGGQGKT